MQQFEYKVVPAPLKGEKVRGARTTGERFAAALMSVMNSLGRDGWEYLRADTLPCEERVGLTGKSSSFLHMLVFRRALAPVEAPVPASAVATPPPSPEPPPTPPRTLVAVPPEGAAPRVAPFVKPVAAPPPAPSRDADNPGA